MTSLVLVLPYPPSINHYWRRVGNSTKISEKGRVYRSRVVSSIHGVRTRTGRLVVRMDVYQPDRRRRDLDNLPKAVLDALAHAKVYEDDSQIDDLRIVRQGVDKALPRVEISIEEMGL